MVGKKVLLTEEIAIQLENQWSFFRRSSLELLVARTGREAFAMAVDEHPDLVILDLDLPEIAGDECCRRIRKRPDLQQTPVILIAPGHRSEEAARGRSADCTQLLTRPVSRHLLLAAAGRYLEIAERTAPRVSVRLHLRYGIDPRRLRSGCSSDLSPGGVFIATDEQLPAETMLFMEFSLPQTARAVRCRGRVAWVNQPGRAISSRLPAGMGVQFVDLGRDDLLALEDFVKQRCPGYAREHTGVDLYI